MGNHTTTKRQDTSNRVGARLALASALLGGAATFALGALGVLPASAATYTITATIPVGASPYAAGVDTATDTIYVPNFGSGTVSVINGVTNSTTATIPVGRVDGTTAVDSSTDTVYVTTYNGSTGSSVTVINGATNSVTATIPIGNSPEGISVDQATDTIYVASYIAGTVSVINGATNTVTATIPVAGGPAGLSVDPSTDLVYVAVGQSNSVSVINGATNTVTNSIPVGTSPLGVAVNPTTNTIYVTNGGSANNSMSVINGTTDAVTATVPGLGDEPYNLGIDPSTNTIYVIAGLANQMSVVNGATNTVIATVPGTNSMFGVGVDPLTHTVYVTEAGSNGNPSTVSVINAIQPYTVAVSGTQVYGSSSPTFVATTAAPAGDTLNGTLKCTTVGTPAAAISPSLAPGSYALNGSNCSGVILSGPTAVNYSLILAGTTFIVTKAPTTLTVTPEGFLYNTLSAKLTANGVPLPGQSVAFRTSPTTLICTATTNAAGLASCNVSLGIELGNGTYAASYAGNADDAGSSGSAPL